MFAKNSPLGCAVALFWVLFVGGAVQAEIIIDDFSQTGQSYGVTYPSTTTTLSYNLGPNAGLGSSVNRSMTATISNLLAPGTPTSQFAQYGVSGTIAGSGGDFRALTNSQSTNASVTLAYTFSPASLSGFTANIWLPSEPRSDFRVRVVDAFGRTGLLTGQTGGFVPGTGLTAAADYTVSFAGLTGVDTTRIQEVDLTLVNFSDRAFVDNIRVTEAQAVPAPAAVLLILAGAPLFLARRAILARSKQNVAV
jgi:hypothetical protein